MAKCNFCPNSSSSYSCPRCNAAYCSLACYRRPEHEGCYEEFYREFGRFLRIGIVTTESQTDKEDLAKLLRFESSKEEKGTLVSLDQYIERAP